MFSVLLPLHIGKIPQNYWHAIRISFSCWKPFKRYWRKFENCAKPPGVLRFWRINSPAKQRMPWALATTATTMTMTMIRATMTIAITGPLPASGKWNVSKSAFCLFVWKCMAGSSWLSEGKLVTKQTDYQTEALHQVQSSPVLLCHKGKLERKVKDF